MILHLGFDVCVEADKVMKHIAQLCKSQIKKASQSVCGIPLADGNEQESIGKSGLDHRIGHFRLGQLP